MPLKIVKIRRPTVDDALNGLILTSSVTKEIADIMQFPPAQAAAGVLLLVFETIQHVQTSKQDCYRLAQRCLSLLVEMRDQMGGRWDSAPPSLIKALSKYEETVQSIHKFMQEQADQKWSSRLIRKGTIDTALKHHNQALDDAARSFQIATLISIHLSVGDPAEQSQAAAESKATKALEKEEVAREPTLPPYASQVVVISDAEDLCSSPVPVSATTDTFSLTGMSDISSISNSTFGTEEGRPDSPAQTPFDPDEYKIVEHHGFNQYHQSQFRIKGKSRIKGGWWADTVEGEVDGRKAIMLRYEDSSRRNAMKRWMRDVKILQMVYHPNLPQMVGYSNDETPTPFIMLANVQTRLPQAMLLDAIKNGSLAICARLLLRFYQDTLDAALYLQRQLDLSDSKLQDYVENADYRIDAEETVVMGLPGSEIDNIESWRNFGLAWSIRNIYLRLIPNRLNANAPVDPDEKTMTVERQRKVNHLTILARALLPDADNLDLAKARLSSVLHPTTDEDVDEEAEPAPLTLRQIRRVAFDGPQQAWQQKTVPPHKFSVGDLGYMPDGSSDWADFVVLTNVLKDGQAAFEVPSYATGRQGAWVNRAYDTQNLAAYERPGGVYGWAVAVPPEAECDLYIVHETVITRVQEAWSYLLDAGIALAKTHGVKPEELILVTRIGTEQRFRVKDLRTVQYWPASITAPQSFGNPYQQSHLSDPFSRNGFGHQFGHGGGSRMGALIHGQDLSVKMFYLFTSGDKDHASYFSDRPVPVSLRPGEKPPELDSRIVKCFAYRTATYGFLGYVQLHAEDFT
ncbi:hypothetical protein BD413DRAFT_610404 [Trametes elegans]|nr:hypothetical protein BD413DRAFT_610404 [Trametes elegans]